MAKSIKQKELGIIHIGKKELGFDDEQYRDYLEDITGKRSAKNLNQRERGKVIDEMKKDGANVHRPWKRKVKPARDKAPMIKKVFALLYALDRPKSYALGVLKQMYPTQAPAVIDWATHEQLHKLIAALEYQKNREGK